MGGVMNQRQYAASMYRVAALRMKPGRSQIERAELARLCALQRDYENAHQDGALTALLGIIRQSNKRRAA
jgi:hypothetical protein